jgi:hypothetical protein
MAAVEPYAPCPCGSGEKFKWCCHKVEPFAERAARQAESGQVEAALATLDEGLRKSPDNPWLATRKAVLLARREEFDAAREALARVVQKRPRHVGAQGFLVQLALRQGGGPEGAAQLQRALSALTPEQRAGLWMAAEVVGTVLVEEGQVPAGLAHLELADALTPDDQDPTAAEATRMVESNQAVSAWLRNPYELSAPPDDLDDARAKRFGDALDAADRGLWAAAASAFYALSQEGTPESDRNLGLCRLFLGDEAGAVEALRRHTRWVGANPDTVDLEALCQLIAPVPPDQQVDLVLWSWNVRDRDALLAALRADDRVKDNGRDEFDIGEDEAVEADAFLLLDRARDPSYDLDRPETLPRVLGRLFLTRDRLALEAYDDGRLDGLAARVRALAGDAIPPAQPKTEALGQIPRHRLAMRDEWLLPDGLDEASAVRVQRAERRRVYLETWPEQPQPYLDGRTPRQAARDGDAELPLRAAVCQFELIPDPLNEGIDYAALRRELNLPDEPAIDPRAVEIEEVHLARLHRIPADRLDDDRLVALFQRAHRFAMLRAVEAAGRALVERPHLLDREGGPTRLTVFGDLSDLALIREEPDAARDWLRRGRESVPPEARAASALRWELRELRLHSRLDAPEQWVPELAAILERARGEEDGAVLLPSLMEMGLVRLSPNPDRPGAMIVDTRPLQALLSRFGPRITTATGELGVSATKGGIWTPGSEAGTPGGLWTPGQSAPDQPEGERSKLIIPGR